jgi:1-phosphofructokinase family hexose kinase
MIQCVLLNPTIDRILQIPNFEVGGTFQVSAFDEFPVGKAISVALTLKEIKEKVSVIAFIGKEEISQYEAFLNGRDIKHILIPIEGKTRSNTTILDTNQATTTHIRFPGFAVNQSHLKIMEKHIQDNINKDDFVILSGSFPNGVPNDYHLQLSKIIEQRQARFIVDTSGKPLETLQSVHPYIIKANLEEMSSIIGKKLIEKQELTEIPNKTTIKNLALSCRESIKIKNLFNVLTLGKYGAILFNSNTIMYSYLEVKNAIYTVGCGDAFMGGLVAGMNRNYPIEDIFRLATACGAANTQCLGAGILNNQDVEKFKPQVKIQKIIV